jgi:hypothetical protein
MILVIYDLTCKLFTHIVVQNPRPQSDRNWDNRRGWQWCEDHMCSPSVNAFLRYFIKRSTLITSSFPWGPAATGWYDKRCRASFSLQAHTTIYGTHAYDCLVLGCFIIIYLQCPCLTDFMNYLIHATPIHLSLCLQYFILLFTIATIIAFILLLLLLFHYYHHYKLLLLINRCEQVYFQVQLNWQLIC